MLCYKLSDYIIETVHIILDFAALAFIQWQKSDYSVILPLNWYHPF